jgi:hypothetical protein
VHKVNPQDIRPGNVYLLVPVTISSKQVIKSEETVFVAVERAELNGYVFGEINGEGHCAPTDEPLYVIKTTNDYIHIWPNDLIYILE